MDGHRFDELTRALAGSVPRRTFFRAMLGLAAGVSGATKVDARTSRTRPTIPPPPPPDLCPGGVQKCNGSCCPADQTCCNGSCCVGTCENGVCCETGAIHCGNECCSAGTHCCGSICCASADLCSASGNRCCDVGTSVCGEECCAAGQSCCDGECCDGACYQEELCCPWDREVCQGTCCASGETCCGVDGCCDGYCFGEGQFCCVGQVDRCGDECCDTGTETCCTDESGQETCVPIGGCCRDDECGGDGGCDGVCNPDTAHCQFPGGEQSCGESVCATDGQTLITLTCDGEGGCEESRISCGDLVCANGECTATCSTGSDCVSGLCLATSLCCPPDDLCDFVEEPFCCQPTSEHPGYSCCPAGDGCCDCFVDSRSGPFCCGDNTTVLCPSPDGWQHDSCISTSRYTCVDGAFTYREYVCDGDQFCDRPCCGGSGINAGPGGTCCQAGTECAGGACVEVGAACQTLSDGTDVGCPPNQSCTWTEECGPSEGCRSKGTCCPDHRLTQVPSVGAPWGDWQYSCCMVTEEAGASCGGNPYCRMVPDITCTSIHSWTR